METTYFEFDQTHFQIYFVIRKTIININISMDLAWLGLIIPGSYILISTFFLCFPTILHSKKRYKYEPFN